MIIDILNDPPTIKDIYKLKKTMTLVYRVSECVVYISFFFIFITSLFLPYEFIVIGVCFLIAQFISIVMMKYASIQLINIKPFPIALLSFLNDNNNTRAYIKKINKQNRNATKSEYDAICLFLEENN